MAEPCGNCGEEITAGGILKSANGRFKPETVSFVNFVSGASFEELCEKCGRLDVNEAFASVRAEIAAAQNYLQAHISDFPMMTVQYLPPACSYRLKGMLTANVTVGTGFFSEFSQGMSDMFGATNTETGMAYKVNSGETTARTILVNKALNLGANCIIGVDIDYGTTANNSATINMQGTAIVVDDLASLLHEVEYEKALEIDRQFKRIAELNRHLDGDFTEAS